MVKKYSVKFVVILSIFGMLFLSIPPIFTNIDAALITPLSDTMSNQTISASSTNNFSFDSISGIPASGTITLTFPSGFTNVSITSAISSMSGATFAVSGNVVTVTNGTTAVSAGTIVTISNVVATNPSSVSSTTNQYIITVSDSGGDQASVGVVIVSSSTYGSGPSGTKYEVPITINNTNNTSTLTNYQIKVTLNTQSLISGGQMNSNCSDIRFTDSNQSTLLYAWLESGCNTTNTIIWVKVPSIPASSNDIIYLYYGSTTATFNSYMGESPTLSSTYGEYDNGSSVFNFYDNFNGTTISPNYTQVLPSGASINQNNGITISTSSASNGGLIYNTGFSTPFIFEGDVTAVSGIAAGFMLQSGNTPTAGGYGFNFWGGSVASGSMQGGFSNSNNPNLQISTGIMGGTWISNTSQEWYKNYISTPGAFSVYTIPNPIYISIGEYNDSPNSSISFQWIRNRQYTSPEPTTTIGTAVSNLTNNQLQLSVGVNPFITFSISSNSLNIGTLSPTAVSSASNTLTLSSNASNGSNISVIDTNAGLYNIADSHKIVSSTTTLSSGSEGYGINSSTTYSGITIQYPYNRTGNAVGALMSTSSSTLCSSTTVVNAASISVNYLASISNITPSGPYSDTVTFIATGNF